MTNLIFMPTWYDVTVYNVIEIFEEVKASGLKHFGFKDIGPSEEVLKELMKLLHKEKMITYIEVVRPTKEENDESVEMAVRLGVDHIIGGTFVQSTLKILKGTKIKYWPYIGKIIEHPCLLRGTIREITEDAKRVEKLGANGVNILSFRYDGDVKGLISSVKNAVKIPTIATGWINTYEKIEQMTELGVWGFTMGGTSILSKKLVPGGTLSDQLIAALKKIEEIKQSTKRN